MASEPIRIGGLMRCCLETLDDFYRPDPTRRAVEGDRLQCKYANSPDHGNMIFTIGAWEWDRLRDVMS